MGFIGSVITLPPDTESLRNGTYVSYRIASTFRLLWVRAWRLAGLAALVETGTEKVRVFRNVYDHIPTGIRELFLSLLAWRAEYGQDKGDGSPEIYPFSWSPLPNGMKTLHSGDAGAGALPGIEWD